MWFNTDGAPMTMSDWFDSYRSTVQMWINGNDVRGHGPDGRPLSDSSWLMVLHAGWDSADITLPGPPYGHGVHAGDRHRHRHRASPLTRHRCRRVCS